MPAGTVARDGRRGRIGGAWCATVGVLAVVTGASLAAPRVAAGQLDAALGRALHTDRVRVNLTVWPLPALWWGRVDVVSIAARDVHVGSVEVAAFDATLNRVRFDPGALYAERRITIRSLGSAVARATVSQDALARALAAQSSLRDVSVVLRPGRVTLGATVSVVGASVRAAGEGRLVLRDGGAVDLVLDRMAVAGLPVPGALAGRAAAAVNPVLAAGALPFGLRLTRITVGNGEVVLDAAAGSR